MKYRDLNIEFSVENTVFSTVSVALEKLDYPMPMHAHSKNSYEIHYISEGFGKLNTGERMYDIHPGTLYVTGPGIPHEQVADAKNPMVEYCLYVKMDRQKEKAVCPERYIKIFKNNPFWYGNADDIIAGLMKEIISELENRKKGYDLLLESLMEKLIILLIRKYDEKETTETGRPIRATNPDDLTYLTVEEAFLYNYRDLTLEKLASLLNLSSRQTERLLQKYYNKSFMNKKTEARMSAAVNMLKETGKSISEISYEVGYSSVEHFSNAMKKYCGKTPSGIRKEV